VLQASDLPVSSDVSGIELCEWDGSRAEDGRRSCEEQCGTFSRDERFATAQRIESDE
jgi:hypothetical protein